MSPPGVFAAYLSCIRIGYKYNYDSRNLRRQVFMSEMYAINMKPLSPPLQPPLNPCGRRLKLPGSL